MKSPWRGWFGVASFLPAIGVVGWAIWMAAHPELERLVAHVDLHTLSRLPRATLIAGAVLLGSIVLVQLALAAIVAGHMEKRTDLSVAARIGWPVACAFVGSIALPICYFRKIRRAPGSTMA